MKRIYSLVLFLLPLWSMAQDSTALYYAKQISEKNLKTDLYHLASDELEGRDTGKKGQKLAAQYIYRQYKNSDVKSYQNSLDSLSYFQVFNLYQHQTDTAQITSSDLNFISDTDFYITSYKSSNKEEVKITLLYPDSTYSDQFLKGKAVLIFTKNLRKGSYAAFELLYKKKCSAVFYCNPYLPNQYNSHVEFYKRISKNRLFLNEEKQKESSASKEKEKANSKIMEAYREIMKNNIISVLHPDMAAKLLQVSPKDLQKIAKGKKIKKAIRSSFSIQVKNDHKKKSIDTENVISMIKADSPSDEYIILSAHYDHIGKNSEGICYGANDNASGTAVIMEIARQFRNAQKAGVHFKKNILFAAFSGEEKGILGSRYFVQHPVVPLKNISSNLNVDMVGRIDKKHKNSNYIYLLGASHLNPQLKQISDSINQVHPKLELDYSHDHKNDWIYRASDQASFVSHNIPAIFYTNGLHTDYHKPSDTADKINYKALKKVSELVFLTAWDLVQNSH